MHKVSILVENGYNMAPFYSQSFSTSILKRARNFFPFLPILDWMDKSQKCTSFILLFVVTIRNVCVCWQLIQS